MFVKLGTVIATGSPYNYDQKVPILFYGKAVPAGKLDNLKTIDIAPTLARLANIVVPGFVDGRVIK
tara:strand:- start:365 stop:562 length:198 start_codon:yes stop_codon:yes gene_type:complete